EKLKRVDALVENVESCRAALKTGHTAQSLGLPADGIERAQKYDDALKKLNDAIRKLQEEELAARESAASRPPPLYKDRNLQIGLGAGLAAFALGMAFRDTGARYLALLDIPAFGFAALTALRWIGELQGFEAGERRLSVGKDREQKLQAEFDREYFPVKTALKISGAETGKELLELLSRRAEQERKLTAAEAALHAARSDPGLLQALDEQDQLAVEVKALEEEIASSTGGATLRDWRSIEAEIQEIEEALQAAEAGAPSPVTAIGGSFAPAAPGATAERPDPVPRLLAVAQELFEQPVEALGPLLRERASQYLTALTDRRYSGVELDARGHAAAVAPGRAVPAGQLEPHDLDLLYVAVRLTVVEKLAGVSRVPLLLEEPFAGMPEAKLQLLSRMLKHLATQRQVLHVTAAPAHRALADHTAQL
ncbi:MAG: hypothetical protein ACK4N5_18385, partial [Myxococcales bacterium]